MVRHILLRLFLGLGLAAGLSACGGREPEPTAAPTAPDSLSWADQAAIDLEGGATFEKADCMFRIPTDIPRGMLSVECGYLEVLEDRSKPDGKKLRLAAAIYQTQGENPQPDPVVVLIGGAGPFLGFSMYMTFLLNQVYADRDLILLEPRGAGFSEPSLSCPGITDLYYETLAQDPYSYEVKMRAAEVRRACRQKWEADGISLAHFMTTDSAEDLNDLRLALGIRQWNIYANGYSTRVAYELARRHPEGIRSMILDTAIPPQVNYYEEAATNTQQALHLFFQRCAEDTKCDDTYPNLEEVFYSLVDDLNAGSDLVEISDLESGQQLDVLVTGDRLIDIMVMSLNMAFDDSNLPQLPRMIFQIKIGNYDVFKTILGSVLPNYAPVDEGRNDLVFCNEEVLLTALEEIQAANRKAGPQLESYFNGMWGVNEAVCDELRLAKPVKGSKEPVTASIPTLFMSGDFTTDIPPAWSDLSASSIQPAYHAQFTGAGPFVIGFGNYRDCSVKIVSAFLGDPQARPDMSCAAVKKSFLWITLP